MEKKTKNCWYSSTSSNNAYIWFLFLRIRSGDSNNVKQKYLSMTVFIVELLCFNTLHCIQKVSVFQVFSHIYLFPCRTVCICPIKINFMFGKVVDQLCKQLFICQQLFFWSRCPKFCQSLWGTGEKKQRQDHIPVPAQSQRLLTDVAPSSWLKGALLGKSPPPLDLLTQTLPALDQAFLWICRHRCWDLLWLLLWIMRTTHWLDMFGRVCFLPLISFLTLQMQPGVSAHHRPPW